MNVGQFKAWLQENEVDDEAELIYSSDDIYLGHLSLDDPCIAFRMYGILTPNPVTRIAVEFH